MCTAQSSPAVVKKTPIPSTSSHVTSLTQAPFLCACQYPNNSTSDRPNGSHSSPGVAACIPRMSDEMSQSLHRPVESAVTILVAPGSVATHNTLSPFLCPA